MIEDVGHLILGLHGWVVLLLAFAVPLAESSMFLGFVFPGEIAILLAGVLAAQHRVSLIWVLLAGTAGAALGDTIGYSVGIRWGRRLLYGRLARLIGRRRLGRAEKYLAERGGKAVFLARHTATLRVLVPGLAGMARMPYRTFAIYNVTGAFVWVVVTAMLGYLAGANWQQALHLASRIGVAVLIALIAGIGAAAGLRVARRRAPAAMRSAADTRPVLWVRDRFPRQVIWITRRMDPATPAGLPLTCAAVTAIGCGWLFAGITQDVVAHDPITRLDQRLPPLIAEHRYPWLTGIMHTVTWLGSAAVLVPLLIVVTGYSLYARHGRAKALLLWAGLAGSVLIYHIGKEAVDRPRPPVSLAIAHAGGDAYPSGHATQAIVVWGLAAVLLTTGLARRARLTALTAAVVVVLLVGASRMYLGVHWLTDVLGGYALGGTWLALLLIFYYRRSGTRQEGRNV